MTKKKKSITDSEINKIVNMTAKEGNKYLHENYTQGAISSMADTLAQRLIDEEMKKSNYDSRTPMLMALFTRGWDKSGKNSMKNRQKYNLQEMHVTDYDVLKMYLDRQQNAGLNATEKLWARTSRKTEKVIAEKRKSFEAKQQEKRLQNTKFGIGHKGMMR